MLQPPSPRNRREIYIAYLQLAKKKCKTSAPTTRQGLRLALIEEWTNLHAAFYAKSNQECHLASLVQLLQCKLYLLNTFMNSQIYGDKNKIYLNRRKIT